MKQQLGYDETINKLDSRITAHDYLAEKDIDPWILDMVKIEKNERILDVGCGTGKQVLSFGKALQGSGYIVATDISLELLMEDKNNASRNSINNVFYIKHSMNTMYPFYDHTFDIISSCFAVYYVDDPENLLK
jgi:ubiquinone/menaquinone biosynthesis C-methylase UbiE